VGKSAAIREVLHQVSRVAPLPFPALVVGETGTGKELVAREIHRKSRRTGPFVPVNCACLPQTLLESELFGHALGAFTGADRERPGLFETAHGGTLFLDELETLQPAAQERLLRTLETGEVRRVGDTSVRHVDARVVAATNFEPAALLRAGRLRVDLYYRLSAFQLVLPPLRERLEDIPLIAEHLLQRIARQAGMPRRAISLEALQDLQRRAWPGNVRQLENALRSAAVACPSGLIRLEDLPPPDTSMDGPAPLTLKGYARSLFESKPEGVPMAQVARTLGISRKTLWVWRRKWRADPGVPQAAI
jgi:transcriptional regulator with PAS, ATPase and Fis domain